MVHDSAAEFVDYAKARLPRLHRTAYLLCGDAHLADDIVQATLISLYGRWKQASVVANLDGYVHRILVRRFIDERRSRWARVTLRNHLFDAPSAPAIAYEERDAVTTALRALPKGQRAVLVLRFYSDLSVEATAQALGCSEGNVKSQCSRGLVALRAALGTPPTRQLTAAVSHPEETHDGRR